MSGYSETNFGADDSITREQMAAMVVRAAKLTEVTAGKKFADNDKISAGATRAEAVTVIAKAS